MRTAEKRPCRLFEKQRKHIGFSGADRGGTLSFIARRSFAAKDRRNRINRIANCMQKNYDKSVLASVSQVQAIEQLEAAGELDSLDAGLRAVARARLEDKEATLTELAQRLGVSKSLNQSQIQKTDKNSRRIIGGDS